LTDTTANYVKVLVDAGTLTLAGNITSGAGTGGELLFLNGQNTGTNTISGVISDNTSSNQTSLDVFEGTWALSAANTFSGSANSSPISGTLINANGGVLLLDNTNALENTTVYIENANGLTFNNSASNVTASTYNVGALSDVDPNNGQTFTPEALTDINGHAITLVAGSNNASTEYDGVLSGNGGLTKVGTGTMLLSGATSGNTYTGMTTVSGGELDLDKTGSGANAIAIDGNATVSGGVLKLLLSNQIDTGATVAVTSGTLNFNGKNQTINSLSNSGGTVLYGTGTVTITDPSWSGGTNTITGTTNFGSLDVSGGTNTVGTSSANSGTLTVGGDYTTPGTGLTFSGTSTFTAMTVNSGGTLALSPTAVTGISTATNSGAGIAGLTGTGAADIAGTGTVSLGGATQTVNVANSGTSLEIDPTIVNGSGTGAISKTGAGSLIVTGANTYSGGTTISAGTINVNNGTTGSATGSGAVTVNSSGTLAGNGTIASTSSGVTVNSGGFLNSGGAQTSDATHTAVAGTGMTLNNAAGLSSLLTVNGGSTLTFDLGTGSSTGTTFANPNENSTFINVTGTNKSGEIMFGATGGQININLVDLTAYSSSATLQLRYQNPYLLIQTGATDDSDFGDLVTTGGVDKNGFVLGIGTSTSAYEHMAFNLTATNINGGALGSPYNNLQLYLYDGDLEVIPEPGTWALLLGGLALLIFIQRRRNKMG